MDCRVVRPDSPSPGPSITYFLFLDFGDKSLTYDLLQPGLGLISTMSGELILTLRVIALWNKSRILMIALFMLLTAEAAILIVAATQFFPAPVPVGTGGCFATGSPGGHSL